MQTTVDVDVHRGDRRRRVVVSGEQLVIAVLKAAVEEAPEILEIVEGWCKGERAKRVEEIRPTTSHAQGAVDRLKEGD